MGDTTIRVSDITYKLLIQCRGTLEHNSGLKRTIDDTLSNIAIYFLKNNQMKQK